MEGPGTVRQDGNPASIPPSLNVDVQAMMNQQPPVFGTYGSDASPVTPLGAPAFGDDHYGGGLDEANDAKRRRIPRACDMCRKKKIKCDGRMPKCSHCINYKTECVFTQVEKKRNPPKGAKYIEGLENRLGRMESLLRLSGLLSESDASKTDLGALEKRLADRSTTALSKTLNGENQLASGSSTTIPQSHNSTPPSSRPKTPAPLAESHNESNLSESDHLSDMMCSLVTNNCGETRFIGSSSGFSIFSPKGIQWVNEKTGDTSFQEMISSSSVDDNKWIHWKPEVFSDIFARRVFKPLPPKDEAISLFSDFFQNFNSVFPLFHEPTFMHLVERQYSRDPYEGSGWWASINIALAIAHRLRVMSNLVPQEEDKKAWLYLKNSMGVLTELTMRNTDLLSVQALLGMALFLQGTSNPQPTFFLVSAAVRLAHSIGLHKRGSGFGLNPVELEQRKRVFWIAYLLDKDISLRSGRPPAQDDDDMNIELPNEDPADNIGNIPLSDGKGKLNIFRLQCRFSIIQSKVYKQLYSTRAARQSDGELLNTIGELDRELEEWKDGIPIDFRPEHEIKATHRPLVLHIVVLHLSYYNCLATIHRMSVHHGYWTSRLSNYAIQGLNARPLNPRVFSSAALCVTAARSTIHLIKYIPQGNFCCVWLILYFPISALVTLFASILQNPQDARARSDVKLMGSVVNFLSTLVTDESNGSVRRMLGVCSEFERIAKVVVDRAEKEAQSKRKRKSAADINGQPHTEQGSRNDSHGQTPQPNVGGSPSAPSLFTPGFTAAANANGNMSRNNTFSSNTDTQNQSSATLPPEMLPPVPEHKPHLAAVAAAANVAQSHSQPPQQHQTPVFTPPLPDMLSPGTNAPPPFASTDPSFPATDPLGVDMSGFSQPFVPQDLWQMSMALEWDWPDIMSGFQYNPNADGGDGGGR